MEDDTVQNHRDIIAYYTNRIAETYTEADMRNVAMSLLAHLSYLLGRESVRGEEDEDR